ncbi:hypothetical protein CPT_Ptah_003 [Stenotrophomonas phage Ptah]|uniref:Uncharacterized protein n=1 Tax=Stenotrophomonas phage Ptah TaxID=2859657 RepID=A0AAE7WNW6_9CAUD|nr:hypothetical protein CPT_Ptah_003 [Stenotrophomonas phage Ptah]
MKLTVSHKGKVRPTPATAKPGVLYLVKLKPGNTLGDGWNNKIGDGLLMTLKMQPRGAAVSAARFAPIVERVGAFDEFSVGSEVAAQVELFEVRSVHVEVDV